MAEDELLKSPLQDRHVAMEAVMGSDGGWEMPLSFRGAIEEAAQVRSRAGSLDLSNIGRIRLRGYGAVDLLERLCTTDIAHQEDYTCAETLLCNATGGIIDQCLAVRLDDWWVLTTSCGNRLKVLEYLQAYCGDFDVKADDQTTKTACICVAGPAAEEILHKALPLEVAGLNIGQVKTGSLLMARYIAMRTNYMGQWALEVILPNIFVSKAWRFITDKAGENAVTPVGIAARDILRIEAGRPRYGHELNETIDPFTAGLSSLVKFDHDFIGRDALEKLRAKSSARRLVGLVFEINDNKPTQVEIAKLGSSITSTDGRELGAITSGTFSPTLGKPIAMGYVSQDAGRAGTEVVVTIDSAEHTATIVDLPFSAS